MWPRIDFLYLLAFFQHIASQPITDDPNNMRQVRQLDFGECCPCPGSIIGQGSHGEHGADQLARASDVDDCPCRLRHADSEAAPSIFFPSGMRSDRPFMKPNDPKEDPKNLLEPEVGLASSVLETLREATEEDYQDALARDAARMAAEAEESALKDAVPEESARNIVTIILKPEVTSDREDELISEASHVQESRCIHPIGSSSLNKMRLSASKPKNLFNDILRLPKSRPPGLLHKNLLGMDSYVGASNVEEHMIEDTGSSYRYNSHLPISKQHSPKKNILENNVDDCNRSKVPYFTPASILDKINEPLQSKSNLFDSFSLPLIPRRKIGGLPLDVNINNNLSPAPNNVQEFELASENVREFPKLTKRPIKLKNLLKLRDVELIPPRNIATKVKVNSNRPRLGLSPVLNSDNSAKINKWEDDIKEAKLTTNIQYTPNDTTFSNKILDLVTSPSNTYFRDSQQSSNDCESKTLEPEQSAADKNFATASAPSENDALITPDLNNLESNIIQPNENLIEENDVCDSSTESNDSSEELKAITQTAPNKEIQDENLNEVILIVVDEEQPEADFQEIDTIQIDQLSTETKENDGGTQDCLEKTVVNGDQDSAGIENNVIVSANSKPEINDSEIEKPCNQDIPVTSFRNTEDEVNANTQSMTTEKTKLKVLQPLSETMSSIKENVLKKIGKYQKSSKLLQQAIVRSAEDQNNAEEEEQSISNDEVLDSECLNEESAQTTISPEQLLISENLEEETKSSDSISFKDLQTLSDSLLHKSTDKEVTATCEGSDNFEIGSEASNAETKNIPTTDSSSSNVKEEDVKSDNSAENSCPTNLETLHSSESNNKLIFKSNSQPNEMTVEASDSFINTAPREFLNPFKGNKLRSSLLQDIIVQPPSLANDDFNLFGRPVSDILNLNTKLPTLDDLRLRLSNIFNTDERSVEDASESIETDCTNDSPRTSDPVMSTDASDTNFVSKLAPLKPLEDVNIDIFQLKPLTRTQSDWITSPRLNLNSYRTKLPIPKNLDLKPIKLESALGNKSGIFGASITTVPKNVGSARRTKPSTALNRKAPESLGNPLENLPSLDDLKDSLILNTKNLLSSPLHETNMFKDSLRSSPKINDLSENLRSHAESAMKNIQQTMETTLKEAKLNDFNLLGDSKKPQQIIEMVSRTHDDMNDKLRGLHYDLNDRLTSMHENLFDQSRLMTNSRPIIKEITNRNSNNKLFSNPNRDADTLRSSKPSQVQSLINRKESQNKDSRMTSQRNTSSKPLGKYAIEKVQTPVFKMPAAASAPVPKSIDPPKLKSEPSKSPLLHMLREPSLKKNIGYTGSSKSTDRPKFEGMKPPTLRKNIYPFKDTKIKITFSTTTARPISTEATFKSKQLLATTPAPNIGTLRTPRPFSGSGITKANLPKAVESKGRPIGLNPSRSPATPKFPNHSSPNLKAIDNLSFLSPTNRPVLKQLPRTQTFDRNEATVKNNPLIKETSPLQPSLWPKITDNSFLSTVREAVLARLSSTDSTKHTNDKVNKPVFNVDMLKSASEKSDIVEKGEPVLKENTSYKCRMVCTREE